MKYTPVQQAALNIGKGLSQMGKSISSGVKSTLNFGGDVASQTASKIKATDKKIKAERRKQTDIDRATKENIKRGNRERQIENRKTIKFGRAFGTGIATKQIDGMY